MTRQLTPQEWGMMLGQRVVVGRSIHYIVGVVIDCDDIFLKIEREVNSTEFLFMCTPEDVSLALRTLDQMTEAEKEEFIRTFIEKDWNPDSNNLREIKFYRNWIELLWSRSSTTIGYYAEYFDWLTQRGFDIRGWIEQGFAIKYNHEVHGEWR